MLIYFFLTLPLFLLALVAHEYAHGWVANRLGDPTAKHFGRLTFNPLAHIDIIGTIMLPIFLLLMRSSVIFGWAKPVPINFSFLKNPKRDMLWVGLAGPLANIAMAIFIAVLLKATLLLNAYVVSLILSQLALINVVLAVFNMLPIPPLDGSRILFSILPNKLAVNYIKLEPFGLLLLLGFLWLGLMAKIVWPAALIIIKLLGINI